MAKKRCLPGLAKWDMYAGGTSCPDHVHNYGYTGVKGNYKVSCVTNAMGRMRGYVTRFENVKGMSKHPGLHQEIARTRSPVEGAAAANKHCELMEQGLAGARRRKR